MTTIAMNRRPSRRAQTETCRRGTGCDQSTWLVTAPHDTPRPLGERGPWGTWHVKRNGDLQTACGLSTVNWHIFWDREPTATDAETCGRCMRVMAIAANFTRDTCA